MGIIEALAGFQFAGQDHALDLAMREFGEGRRTDGTAVCPDASVLVDMATPIRRVVSLLFTMTR